MPDPPPSLRFPRARRLRQSREFAHARARGQRLACGCLLLNWLPLAAGSPTRLGVVTSRKVGPAVARSRARRLLREAFRRHQHHFTSPLDLVLVARPSIVGKDFAAVERDFLAALRRTGLLKPNELGATPHHV